MRYYSIKITDAASGAVATPPGFAGLLGDATYTSFVSGRNLPGAWNVELDIPVVRADLPMGGSLVRVWGISLQEISQASDLNGKLISVFGGMQKGLPLANPRQAGLLAKGYIYQAFGNWINTDMTLDLIVYPGAGPNGLGTLAQPKNLVLNWRAGTTLSQALAATLRTAYPDLKQTINISDKLKRSNDEVGFYPTLIQLSQYVRQASQDIVGGSYPGVSITVGNDSVSVYDDSAAPSGGPTRIEFQDIIGQPTWIEAPSIFLKCVMRADLKVGDRITLPPAVTTNTQQAQTSLVNQKLAFQGDFSVTQLRHVGNFRQSSADSWVTVITAAPVPAST